MNEINKNIQQKKSKRERIKINDINDFKKALEKEGYILHGLSEKSFKGDIKKTFGLDTIAVGNLYQCLEEEDVSYRVDNILGFIDYVEKINIFQKQHNELCEKIISVKNLIINRIEYQREPRIQEDIGGMMDTIEKTANEISEIMKEKDKYRLEKLEKQMDEEHLYTKDIELLKKIIINQKGIVKEEYNEKTQVKTLSIKVPDNIECNYIKAQKGTVEYHQHLTNTIPRMQRLIRNVSKYMVLENEEEATFKINQSNTLQDSINIAVATFNNKKFRAISGSNEVANCCISPRAEKASFKSRKVNKLGKLGIGYDRVNDSEKKIFEEIHKQINKKILKDNGELTLYSKWEPCPSCYYVINQFREKHPNINIKVKYIKKYGSN